MDKTDLIIQKIDDLKGDNNKSHDLLRQAFEKLNGQTRKNTEFRVETDAKLALMKGLVGFLGAGNAISLVYMWVSNYNH